MREIGVHIGGTNGIADALDPAKTRQEVDEMEKSIRYLVQHMPGHLGIISPATAPLPTDAGVNLTASTSTASARPESHAPRCAERGDSPRNADIPRFGIEDRALVTGKRLGKGGKASDGRLL